MPFAFGLLASGTPGTVISPEILVGYFAIILVPTFAIILAGFIAGFIVGAIPGALIGLVIGGIAELFIEEPLMGNPYLDGTAFDCELLKKAYAEMVKATEGNDVCANDEVMRETHPQNLNLV